LLFDPKLGLSPEAAYEIELNGFGDDPLQVLITSVYPTALARVLVDGEPFVRAATGDEVTDALTTGLVEEGDDLVWPGDAPMRVAQRLSWRDRPDSQLRVDDAVRLWSGEVIFSSGQGKSGPFYVHKMAATAWAFSNALAVSAGEVFGCQVVPYACARRFAPDVLRVGEAEARRLSRFDVAPLWPWGPPTPVAIGAI
jgi:hypothetical protein